jgi:hypothetical protein
MHHGVRHVPEAKVQQYVGELAVYPHAGDFECRGIGDQPTMNRREQAG